MSDRCVFAIEEICTLNGSTPQGAPTSPTISNFILFSFDDEMANCAVGKDLVYTRYADDITISGNRKEDIISLIDYASSRLIEYGFKLNAKKTRIASYSEQQRVTGIVVNQKLQPTRKKRKKIRAIFHNASCNPTEWVEHISVLKGYISYLQSFSCLRDSSAIRHYKNILNLVCRCLP
jgi:retron-type reverse transcriptase